MKIDPRQLENLAAIVQSGGLTEGAAALGKSQPSVSRPIAALEARLGSALFLPGRRPLPPTELGLRLTEEGRHILQAGQAAAQAVQSFKLGKAGAVRMAGTPTVMDGGIVGMIAGFQAQNPEVQIEQRDGYALIWQRKCCEACWIWRFARFVRAICRTVCSSTRCCRAAMS